MLAVPLFALALAYLPNKLTKLALKNQQNSFIRRLAEGLPLSTCEKWAHSKKQQTFIDIDFVCSCQGLTRLELSNGNFLAGGTWQFYVPPKLKEVSFKNMNLDTSWLNVFTWSTPGLGQLKLETCKLRGRYNEKWEDKETPLKPMRSLR